MPGDSMYNAIDHFGQPNFDRVVVGVAIPTGSYLKTNFKLGYTYVAVSDSGISQAVCYGFNLGDEESKMIKNKTFNGINYKYYRQAGAAAGTFTSDEIYHTFQNNRCYEITITTWFSNIGNYEPESGVKEANEAEINSRLQIVLNTFSFSSPSYGYYSPPSYGYSSR